MWGYLLFAIVFILGVAAIEVASAVLYAGLDDDEPTRVRRRPAAVSNFAIVRALRRGGRS